MEELSVRVLLQFFLSCRLKDLLHWLPRMYWCRIGTWNLAHEMQWFGYICSWCCFAGFGSFVMFCWEVLWNFFRSILELCSLSSVIVFFSLVRMWEMVKWWHGSVIVCLVDEFGVLNVHIKWNSRLSYVSLVFVGTWCKWRIWTEACKWAYNMK